MPTRMNEESRRSAVCTIRLRPRDREMLERAAERAAVSRAEFAAAAVLRAAHAWLHDDAEGERHA